MNIHPVMLTIAIPTYNRCDALILTLRHLISIRKSDEEVLVLDQNHRLPDSASVKMREWAHSGAISWVHLDKPSLTAARNEALRRASGDIILFLDDDVFIPRETIEAHRRHYSLGKGVSAVTGQVYQCSMEMNYPPSWEGMRSVSQRHFTAQTE